jgi:hypothetical protein
MIVCPNCKHENEGTPLTCANCNRPLVETGGDETVVQRLPLDMGGFSVKSGWGTSTFEPESQVIIHIQEASQPIIAEVGKELRLGRQNIPTGLDLTNFGGIEKGVSRIHAALRRGDGLLLLVDLDSTNGTFLNDQLLIPNQPRLLRSGDKIRLGQLTMHIYFSVEE